jgi:hypothetical protein
MQAIIFQGSRRERSRFAFSPTPSTAIPTVPDRAGSIRSFASERNPDDRFDD